jgi:hypothetical protein
VSYVLQASHLTWTGVPLNYGNNTVTSQTGILPDKLIVAQIANTLLSVYPTGRIVSVFTTRHWPSVHISIEIRFNIIWSSSVFHVVSFVQDFRPKFCTHFSHIPQVPYVPLLPSAFLFHVGLQWKLLNSLCISPGTPITSLIHSALCSNTVRLSETCVSLGGDHKQNSLLGCDATGSGILCANVSYERVAYMTSLMMQSAHSSETSVGMHQTTGRHISQDAHFPAINTRTSDESARQCAFRLNAKLNSCGSLWPFRFYVAKCPHWLDTVRCECEA